MGVIPTSPDYMMLVVIPDLKPEQIWIWHVGEMLLQISLYAYLFQKQYVAAA